MPFETRCAVVAESSPYIGGRVDRLIQELVGGTRAHIAGVFDHDCVAINGQTTRDSWRRLLTGDHVQVRFEVGRRYHERPRPRMQHGFTVVYEDRNLIVVDKAPELLTVPTERNEPNTLVGLVDEHVRRAKSGKGAFPVHRLDRGVSGLLVLGKTKEIADQIRDQFAARKPERKYVAIVSGLLAQTEGEFCSYLATDKSLNRYSTDDEEIGQYAATHYRVEEHFAETTFVEVWLETGRRNQIRVHFSEAGHPVLGDPRYQPELANHHDWPYKRIALHAKTLGLEHPVTGAPLKCDSQLPREMVSFIVQARRRTGHGQAKLPSRTPFTRIDQQGPPRKNKRRKG